MANRNANVVDLPPAPLNNIINLPPAPLNNVINLPPAPQNPPTHEDLVRATYYASDILLCESMMCCSANRDTHSKLQHRSWLCFSDRCTKCPSLSHQDPSKCGRARSIFEILLIEATNSDRDTEIAPLWFQNAMARLNQRLDDLDRRMNQRMVGLEQRMNQRLDDIDHHLNEGMDALGQRLDATNQRLAQVSRTSTIAYNVSTGRIEAILPLEEGPFRDSTWPTEACHTWSLIVSI
jgi:hypothetical protein